MSKEDEAEILVLENPESSDNEKIAAMHDSKTTC